MIAPYSIGLFFLFLLSAALSSATTSMANTLKKDEIAWTDVEPGLQLGYAPLPEYLPAGSGDQFIILRVDPFRHSFGLHMATESGQAHSLRGWAQTYSLKAGINAGMYLKDNLTSTGFMRTLSHVNNPRMGERLGAFFVAWPRKKRLPAADIVERHEARWQGAMDDYGQVVQNYRLISSGGKILWPEEGPVRSIAVVAKDARGNILFILCQAPLTAADFSRHLLSLPLDLGPVMYVEGGAQAGIFLREKGQAHRYGAESYPQEQGVVHVWKGRQGFFNTRGNPDSPLPNIIGIYPDPEIVPAVFSQ